MTLLGSAHRMVSTRDRRPYQGWLAVARLRPQLMWGVRPPLGAGVVTNQYRIVSEFGTRMPSVSVIASIHNDLGRADALSLRAILEDLRPEVLFLEQPAPGFDTFCREPRTGLEARAVCSYRLVHGAILVPVDLPNPPPLSRSDMDALYDSIEAQSPDYARLVRVKDENTARFGFAFLNSPECSTLWSRVHAAEQSAVEATGRTDLKNLYQLWRTTHERREEGVMRNIEDYCRNNAFERGIFIIGSAHRQSVYDKSRDRAKAGPSAVSWLLPRIDQLGAA